MSLVLGKGGGRQRLAVGTEVEADKALGADKSTVVPAVTILPSGWTTTAAASTLRIPGKSVVTVPLAPKLGSRTPPASRVRFSRGSSSGRKLAADRQRMAGRYARQ